MAENKHEAWELAQMQSLPLSAKIRMTQDRIKGWYDEFDGQVYVSVSGGKDSQVLAHIVKQMYQDVPCVFVNTGLEYTSVRKKGIEIAGSENTLQPQKSFLNILTEYGYPIISKEISQAVYEINYAKEHGKPIPQYRTIKFEGKHLDKNGKKSPYNCEKYAFLLNAPFRISHKCCTFIKKKPSYLYEKETGRKPFIGTLASESALRRQKWLRVGCNAFDDDRPTSQPMSFWKESDVLQYIVENKLELADIYGVVGYKDDDGMIYEEPLFGQSMNLQTTGVNRTGCVYCMFGIQRERDKFLELKKQEPMLYDYVMCGGCFDDKGMWIPGKDENGVFGLGYKFVIDWLNEHGNLKIKY